MLEQFRTKNAFLIGALILTCILIGPYIGIHILTSSPQHPNDSELTRTPNPPEKAAREIRRPAKQAAPKPTPTLQRHGTLPSEREEKGTNKLSDIEELLK